MLESPEYKLARLFGTPLCNPHFNPRLQACSRVVPARVGVPRVQNRPPAAPGTAWPPPGKPLFLT